MSDLHSFWAENARRCMQCRPKTKTIGARLEPGNGPHAGKLSCAHCGKFIRWASEAEMRRRGTGELDPIKMAFEHP